MIKRRDMLKQTAALFGGSVFPWTVGAGIASIGQNAYAAQGSDAHPAWRGCQGRPRADQWQVRRWPRQHDDGSCCQERTHHGRGPGEGTGRRRGRSWTWEGGRSSRDCSIHMSTTRGRASTPVTRRAVSNAPSRSGSCRRPSPEGAKTVAPGAVRHLHRRLEPPSIRRSPEADEGRTG